MITHLDWELGLLQTYATSNFTDLFFLIIWSKQLIECTSSDSDFFFPNCEYSCRLVDWYSDWISDRKPLISTVFSSDPQRACFKYPHASNLQCIIKCSLKTEPCVLCSLFLSKLICFHAWLNFVSFSLSYFSSSTLSYLWLFTQSVVSDVVPFQILLENPSVLYLKTFTYLSCQCYFQRVLTGCLSKTFLD